MLDLMPDLPAERLQAKLGKARNTGLTRVLRNALRLPPEKIAMFQEMTRAGGVTVDATNLGRMLKALPVTHQGPRPIEEAISSAGGVAWSALTDGLELRALPGVRVAGEMLDWEAPTGGYLLTGCLATGRAAGMAVVRAAAG